MIVRPDKQIIKKEKLKSSKLDNIKSTDAMFKNLCHEKQAIIFQRERFKTEKTIKEPVKVVTAEIVAAKKAEMEKIINENNDVIKTSEELKKLKKRELNKKFKKVPDKLKQTKFVETISIKIPLYNVGNHSGTHLRVKSQREPGLIKSYRP